MSTTLDPLLTQNLEFISTLCETLQIFTIVGLIGESQTKVIEHAQYPLKTTSIGKRILRLREAVDLLIVRGVENKDLVQVLRKAEVRSTFPVYTPKPLSLIQYLTMFADDKEWRTEVSTALSNYFDRDNS